MSSSSCILNGGNTVTKAGKTHSFCIYEALIPIQIYGLSVMLKILVEDDEEKKKSITP